MSNQNLRSPISFSQFLLPISVCHYPYSIFRLNLASIRSVIFYLILVTRKKCQFGILSRV